MPGHKRHPFDFPNPYTMDITEIEGFDDLHHPTGEIRQMETGFAKLYGTRDARLLVNGSTAGVMAAIFAATHPGDEILMARNCHSCAYRAAGMRGLSVHYVYPRMAEDGGASSELGESGDFPAIAGEIYPEDFKKMLAEHPAVVAAVVTSPTYEGICSDIPALAEVAHAYGVTLIVDAAHGAHLALQGNLGEPQDTPWRTDLSHADFSVVSLHKTLPAFTGTALLLTGTTLPVGEKYSYYLDCFQTSSPSYLLMASAAKCLRYLQDEGEAAFRSYEDLLNEFYEDVRDLKHLTLLRPKNHDKGKLLIAAPEGTTGGELMNALRKEFSLELEMAAGAYCLAMTSIMDKKEGFVRLSEALHSIDDRWTINEGNRGAGQADGADGRRLFDAFVLCPKIAMSISEAIEAEHELLPPNEAKGQVSGGFASVYPPGIPILCPGEVITGEVLGKITEASEKGLAIRGITNGKLSIVQSGRN